MSPQLLLLELPVDVLLAIFDEIDDESILPLLKVARIPRTIGIITVITRYRSRFTFEDHISLSSSSHSILHANLLSIRSLTCRLPRLSQSGYSEERITPVLRSTIAALPNLLEAHIQYDAPINGQRDPHIDPSSFFKNFQIFNAVLGHAKSPPNVIMIDTHGSALAKFDWISRRRRTYGHIPVFQIDASSDSVSIELKVLAIVVSILFLIPPWFIIDRIYGFFRDPFVWKDQARRLRRDLQNARTPRSVQIIPLHSLNLPSGWAHRHSLNNWTLIIFDRATAAQLNITCRSYRAPFAREHLLLALHYPVLTNLHVADGVRLPISALLDFLARHPTVRMVRLQHTSISLPASATASSTCPRMHIEILHAPLDIFAYLLPYIDTRSLRTAGIGCIAKPHRGAGSIPFDCGQFEYVLRVFATEEWTVRTLELWLPGRRAMEKWLDSATREDRNGERPERRLVHVRDIFVGADNVRVEPFHPNVRKLLDKWLSLFPGLAEHEAAV
ncbi:hypothetical protein Hypma_004984 [Hypsizygus marmoreus]|uniref:Uncharacterized protein n=1 Tax=Hypsizygus marmoreus TaxID=39966 RepID=A0A369K372_HYPMA|nr:hypothetical protein Hypma_004984 [Hypsizygus marmoreus]